IHIHPGGHEGVGAGVDDGAAGQRGHGRGRPAVVLERPQLGIPIEEVVVVGVNDTVDVLVGGGHVGASEVLRHDAVVEHQGAGGFADAAGPNRVVGRVGVPHDGGVVDRHGAGDGADPAAAAPTVADVRG